MSSNNSGKIELLVLCQVFYPELISTGQTLTELCEELVELGVDIEVICGPPTILDRDRKIPKRMEHKGIHIRRVWGTRFPKLNLLGRTINQTTFAVSTFLNLLLRCRRKPVMVLTNPPFLAVSCAILRALKIGAPYIYLVFDVYPDTAVNLGVIKNGGVLFRLWERINALIFKHASAVVVIGRCMESVVKQKAKKLGVRLDDKLHRTNIWSDDKLIRGTSNKSGPNPLKERWGIREEFVVGYFGNMGRFHDIETILEAAVILNDRDICFLFVGEGYKKKHAMEYARNYNLKNCRFHTYVDREELGYLVQLADVGIVSLVEGQEGLSVPSKALGLMAGGVPVIAVMPGESEIARIIQEENCGVLVRPGDEKELANSILQFYNDRAKSGQMGNNALRAVDEKYSLCKTSRVYFDLVKEIVAEETAGQS